jgi:predicted permease
MSLDLGLEPDRVLVTSLRWPATGVLDPQARLKERSRRNGAYVTALDRVRQLPGVARASLAVGLPFNSSFSQFLRMNGRDSIPVLPGGGPYVSAVTSDYFETVGTKVVRGRGFTAADREGSEPVTVIDQTMARTLWPNRDPMGECIFSAPEKDSLSVCARVVGIVADARRFQLREDPAMHYYIPFGQERGFGGTTLLVRPGGDVTSIVPSLRLAIQKTDPSLSYVDVRLLQESIDPQIRPWRLGATLFGFMGLLALVVAAIGLYSVVSYLITQRTHEIGVRIALGARAGSILRLVMRHGMGMAATGVGIGTVIVLIGGRYLAPLLFDTSPRDPIVLAGVAAVMLLVALLASLVPANRARRVDPIEALRYD